MKWAGEHLRAWPRLLSAEYIGKLAFSSLIGGCSQIMSCPKGRWANGGFQDDARMRGWVQFVRTIKGEERGNFYKVQGQFIGRADELWMLLAMQIFQVFCKNRMRWWREGGAGGSPKNFRSLALTVLEWRCFEDFEEKDHQVTQWMYQIITTLLGGQPRLQRVSQIFWMTEREGGDPE